MSTLEDFDRILAELAPPSNKPAATGAPVPAVSAPKASVPPPAASAPKTVVAPPRPSVVYDSSPVMAAPARSAGSSGVSSSNADKIAELESMLLDLGPATPNRGGAPKPTTSSPSVPSQTSSFTSTSSSINTTAQSPAAPPKPSLTAPPPSASNNNNNNNSAPRRNASVSVSKPAPTAASGDIVICGKCAGQINGTYISALDRNWHPEHFACHSCQKALNGNFFDTEKGILCTDCASEQIRCAECQKPITGTHLIYGDGRPVHNECVPKSKCGRCQNILSLGEAHVEALDKLWHPECFACTRCMTPLGATFVQFEGSPYCQACIQILSKERNIVFKT